MRRLILTCVLVGFGFTALAQEADEITIGTRHVLSSDILEEDRPYLVHLPASYDAGPYAPKRYPVLYLLDGGAHFHSATGAVQFMSAGINGNLQVPELIVVAIPNTNRTRDLTPTHTTLNMGGEARDALAVSGGGEAFLGFLRDELIPEIESTYRTMPYRVLVGHSFGGLFAAHALMTSPATFQGYIVIDPSFWWDDQVMARRAEALEAGDLDGARAVFMTLAGHVDAAGVPNGMETSGRRFAEAIAAFDAPKLRFALERFPDENHGSVPLRSLYHGLLHLFSGYAPDPAAFTENPSSIGPHYAAASAQIGLDLRPPERFVQMLGRALMPTEPEKSQLLFELNLTNYPDSPSAHVAIADLALEREDARSAAMHYRHALDLDPDHARAREQLETLRGR